MEGADREWAILSARWRAGSAFGCDPLPDTVPELVPEAVPEASSCAGFSRPGREAASAARREAAREEGGEVQRGSRSRESATCHIHMFIYI